jgi:hypothetical protein
MVQKSFLGEPPELFDDFKPICRLFALVYPDLTRSRELYRACQTSCQLIVIHDHAEHRSLVPLVKIAVGHAVA